MAKEVFSPGPPLWRRLRRARGAFAGAALAAAALAGWLMRSRGAGWDGAALAAAAALAAGDLLWRLRAGRMRAAFLRGVEGGSDGALARGQTLLLAGDRTGAERLLGDLAYARPRDPEAHLYWGLALREQGDLPGAEGAFRKALRIDLGGRWTEEILRLLSPGKIQGQSVVKNDNPGEA